MKKVLAIISIIIGICGLYLSLKNIFTISNIDDIFIPSMVLAISFFSIIIGLILFIFDMFKTSFGTDE